jgi:hypothetical protein
MRASLLSFAAALAALWTVTIGPAAQAAPQGADLAACRAEAVARGIGGEGLTAFLDRCLAQAEPGAAGASTRGASLTQSFAEAQANFGACRSEAAGRGIEGEGLAVFMDRCLAQAASAAGASASRGAAATESVVRAQVSFAACRSEAAARGIAGEGLTAFLDRCLGG